MLKYFVVLALMLGLLGLFTVFSGQYVNSSKNLAPSPKSTIIASLQPSVAVSFTPVPSPTTTPKPALSDVPFTVQAPFAEWKDPRQQDACEEASVLMVMHWVSNEPIVSKQAAKDEILKLSHYLEDKHGIYHDSSAQDTADWLIKGYYRYANYEVKDVTKVEEVVEQLSQPNTVIIVPTNGQALGNPNFTPPGPDRHNLVLKGFDSTKNQFVTNDPGISQGQNYRYDRDVLWKAIRDYPTGDHLPIIGDKKDMIVIRR